MDNLLKTLFLCIIFITMTTIGNAKEKGGDDLAAKTQNPVGAMYSLPFKFKKSLNYRITPPVQCVIKLSLAAYLNMLQPIPMIKPKFLVSEPGGSSLVKTPGR